MPNSYFSLSFIELKQNPRTREQKLGKMSDAAAESSKDFANEAFFCCFIRSQ